jgi:hypothetical protein
MRASRRGRSSDPAAMLLTFAFRWVVTRRRLRLRHAIRTPAPIRDLGLVDFVAPVVSCDQTRGSASGTVHIDHAAAVPADQMVVVVADSILEARRRSGGLNAPEQTFGNQDRERVVHRLKRDGTDLGPHGVGDDVGSDVGVARNSAQHCYALGSDLNTPLPQEISRVGNHGGMISNNGAIPYLDVLENEVSRNAGPLRRPGHLLRRTSFEWAALRGRPRVNSFKVNPAHRQSSCCGARRT